MVGKGLGKLSGSVRASRRGKKDSEDSSANDSLVFAKSMKLCGRVEDCAHSTSRTKGGEGQEDLN